MAEVSGRKTVVVAPSRRWFMTWCQVDNTPPLNPRDPKWVVVTGAPDCMQMRALSPENADIIRLGMPRSHRDADAIYMMLKERGWD